MTEEEFQSKQNIQAKCLEFRNSVTILKINRCTETGTLYGFKSVASGVSAT
jgi:hypothetical protein